MSAETDANYTLARCVKLIYGLGMQRQGEYRLQLVRCGKPIYGGGLWRQGEYLESSDKPSITLFQATQLVSLGLGLVTKPLGGALCNAQPLSFAVVGDSAPRQEQYHHSKSCMMVPLFTQGPHSVVQTSMPITLLAKRMFYNTPCNKTLC